MLFPLGELAKRDVRAIARREGIPTWAKKDSTGICFIGERPFRDFLGEVPAENAGSDRERPTSEVVGRHHGLAYYTLGQRQGLGVGGTKEGCALPWFVAGEGRSAQRARRRPGPRPPAALSDSGRCAGIALDRGSAPRRTMPIAVAAKTRYRMADAVVPRSSFRAIDCHAMFDAPQWAPTPGQYLVFYDGDALPRRRRHRVDAGIDRSPSPRGHARISPVEHRFVT